MLNLANASFFPTPQTAKFNVRITVAQKYHARQYILKSRSNNGINIIISTVEEPSLRIESLVIINLRGVSTKLNYYCIRNANVQGTYFLLVVEERLERLLVLI